VLEKEQESRTMQVTVSDEAYEALQEIAERRDISIAEALKEALALEKWYLETKEDGSRVLVVKDGDARELVYP
jgi:predicted transcriptional regulator